MSDGYRGCKSFVIHVWYYSKTRFARVPWSPTDSSRDLSEPRPGLILISPGHVISRVMSKQMGDNGGRKWVTLAYRVV